MSAMQPKLHLCAMAWPRLLIVMEGVHDILFLKNISRALHRVAEEAPDLPGLEATGKITFVHLEGQLTHETTRRFAPFGLTEFHLYAQKSPREFERRKPIVESLQARPNCTAFLTRKRSFDNYLHPQVVRTCRGGSIDIDDDIDVAEALAARFINGGGGCWEKVSPGNRCRLIHEAWKWLCTRAVKEMTLDLLEERDGPYELIDWLMTIESLISSASACAPHLAHDRRSLVAV